MLKTIRCLTLTLLTASFSAGANAQTCEYYLGYIKGEAERPYALKKVYNYSPERLNKILEIRDEGMSLCAAGNSEEGKKILLEAVKLINFTRLR